MKRYLVLILSVIAAFAAATLSLTACGKVDFTVKFSVDGETYASVSTGGSEVIKMPADPQKDGYTFDGWFWDDGVWARPFTANSLLNEPLKSDMTVYAKFTVNHSHNFNKQVATEPYLKSAATCTAKAVYYYSCECGEKGEQTFEYGDKLPHTFDKQVATEPYLKSAASCTARAVYYFSCECGAVSETETFTYGELKDHTFNGTHTCAVCGYYDDTLIKTEILSKNLSVCGNEVKGKVANAQETFSFINDIEVADGATYTVCTDLACTKPVLSKTINLSVGDNVCYILVTNGNDINLYTVTVRRRPIYTVAFNSNGGTEIKSQQVEEDSFAAKPADPEKTGYDFKGYDYDFNKPIVENTTINAKWQIITYKINYVLNGGINNADNPTTYTVEDKIELKPATKTGYTFASWSDNGIIEKGSTGEKTFTANWQIISYKITYNCGSGKNNANNVTTYNIESKTIKLLDPYYINADFVEWQRGGVKITEIPAGTYGDITITAVWSEYDVTLKLNDDGETYTVIGLHTDKTDIEIKTTYHRKPVTSIGVTAFIGCTSLTSINIPDSVTSIGSRAFGYCHSLTSIKVDENNKNYKSINGNLYSKDGKTLIQYAIAKTGTSFVIPDSVTSIGEGAFSSCNFLTSVIIPDSVTSIGASAFYNCSSLTSVTIPDSVTSIGYYAFKSCRLLTSVTIGNGVTSIGGAAFSGCKSLTSVTIPDSVTSIGDDAFIDCKSLTSITIPDGVTSIGYRAFVGCTSLTSITIPDSVTSIGVGAFSGCTSLTSVTIPDSVTSIGYDAFRSCTSLTSVTIGNGVTSIGDSAFEYCTSLADVIWNAVNCTYAGGYEVTTTNTGQHYYYDHTIFRGCNKIKNITIGENVKTIPNYAFYNCTSLTSVTIPDSVTSIGYRAFAGCTSLESITIPDGVTSIGSSAFSGCSSLTSITIPDGVTSIGRYAFFDCRSLTTINYKGSKEQWVSIRKGTDWNSDTGSYTINYNYVEN